MNDYLARPEPVYEWYDTNVTFKTNLGGTVRRLNLTSLTWLNDTVYTVIGGTGSKWTHEVIIVEPEKYEKKNNAVIWLASAHAGCQTS